MTKFVPIVIASLFLSVHYGSTIYSNSTLLGQFFESNVVSLLFILGALGNILIYLFAPRLIRQFGKRFLLLTSLLLAAASILILATTDAAWLIALAFTIHASFFFITYYCLDIYLEELSENSRTGEIRGIYLTLVSLGIALGPLILSILTDITGDLRMVYFIAAILLIPTFLVSLFFIRSKNPKKHGPYHHSAMLPFMSWWHNKHVRRVTIARLILEVFYTFMVIYIPIYLNSKLGFSWQELGIMFTVMLLPFILFEWPAGELADRLWGEKEIMNTGFIIMIGSLLIMPLLGKTFIVWMTILFVSRVGASLVESMTESYFFKKIDATDTALISIFRLARPVSNILGAGAGILALNYLSYDKIFYVIALLLFFGLKEGLSIKDTR